MSPEPDLGLAALGLAFIEPGPFFDFGLARLASVPLGFVRVASSFPGLARTAPDPALGFVRLAPDLGFVRLAPDLGFVRLAPDFGFARTAPPPALGLVRVGVVLLLGLARTGAFEAGAFEEGAVDARVEEGAVEALDLDAGAFEAGALERGLLLLLLPAWKEQPPIAIAKMATKEAGLSVR